MIPTCAHPACRERPGRLMCWSHWLTRPAHLRRVALGHEQLRREVADHIRMTAQDAKIVERTDA